MVAKKRTIASKMRDLTRDSNYQRCLDRIEIHAKCGGESVVIYDSVFPETVKRLQNEGFSVEIIKHTFSIETKISWE